MKTRSTERWVRAGTLSLLAALALPLACSDEHGAVEADGGAGAGGRVSPTTPMGDGAMRIGVDGAMRPVVIQGDGAYFDGSPFPIADHDRDGGRQENADSGI